MFEKESLPKVIWFLWLQGMDNAPLIVLKCYESWLKHNPGWSVILLTENNLFEYIEIAPEQFTRQALSDIVRINLLAKFGGIWVDATCFCTKALDSWIFDYMTCGFFAFDRPGNDRMLSSWFIASTKNNYIATIYQSAVNNYWQENPGITLIGDSKWHFLNKYLTKLSPQIWFCYFLTKVIKVYPYFWFHYLFEKIYLDDIKVKEMWDNYPKISADVPHTLLFTGLLNELNERVKTEIDNKIAPLYKLTWKYDTTVKKGTIIDYLLNEINT